MLSCYSDISIHFAIMVSTYGHAVCVLQQSVYLNPLPGAAPLNPPAGADNTIPVPFTLLVQSFFQTAARLMSTPNDPAPDTDLPIPKDPLANTYTKHQVIQMLSKTKKGSTPTTTSSLRDLMLVNAWGKPIPTRMWVSKLTGSLTAPTPLPSTCLGIHSTILDKQARFHGEYCCEKGWVVHHNQHRHSKGCTNENVDKNARCVKCRNTYENMNFARYPTLFQPPASPSLLQKN